MSTNQTAALMGVAELEMCVLGAILLEAENAWPLASGLLSADDFYLETHRYQWLLMADLYADGIMPDFHVVLTELRERSMLDRIGGGGVLMAQTNSIPTAANLENHCRKLLEQSRKRQILQLAVRLQHRIVENPDDNSVDSLLAMAQKGIEQISSRGVRESELHYMREVAEAEQARLIALYEHGERPVAGIPTGLRWLDEEIGGWARGDFVMLAARPNHGKSRFLAYHCASASMQGYRVGYISLDMAPAKLYPYLILAAANSGGEIAYKSDIYGLTDWGELSQARLRDIFRAVDRERRWVLVDEPSGFGLSAIEGYVRTLVYKHGCQMIALDQLQNVEGWQRGASDRSQYATIASGLKQMARRYNVPLIVAHQIQREGAAAPTLANLKDSGVCEEFTDTVVMLHDAQRALCDAYGGFVYKSDGVGIKRAVSEKEIDVMQTEVTPTRPVRVGLEKTRDTNVMRRAVQFDYRRGIVV